MRSREDLLALRKENLAADDAFWKRRIDNVQNLKEFAKEGDVDIEAMTEKMTDQYKDRHVAGTFHPIEEFAEERHMQWVDMDDLTAQIEKKYPSYDVIFDENDVLGVEVKDQTGGKYRFQRGVNDKLRVKKVEKHENMEDAKTVFQNKVPKEDQYADSRLARGGSGEISDAAAVKVNEYEVDDGADVESLSRTPRRGVKTKTAARNPSVLL